MANDVKNVALNIGVSTSGTDQVNALAKQLDALAKEGGAAAPEIARLAEEFRKIGAQDAAVSNMARLQAEIEQTSRAFEAARASSTELDAALTTQREKTEALRLAQVSAREALAATAKEVREAKEAQDLLKASSDSATKQSAEYKTELIRLGVELVSLRAKQGEQRAELQQTNQALVASERELRNAGSAYQAASKDADTFSRELTSQRDALAGARAAAQQVGVTATEVAAAQAEVATSMERTRAAALQEVQAFQQLTDIQRHVAESNQRNVEAAKAAAAARVTAAQQVVAAEQAQQRAADAASLAARLAAEQQATAAQQAAAAAQQAQHALQEAFGVIGVRSAREIEGELARVRGALETIRNTAGASGVGLAQAMAQGESRIKALERELRAANGQLTTMDRLSAALKTSMGQFTAGALAANAIQAVVQEAIQLGKEAVTANIELQKLELGLNAVYGSSKLTAQQVEFLRNTAQAAGVSVGEISGAFVKFAASAQSAGIPIEQVNGLFSALSKNAATLGLSGDKVADMLNALGQMAGKGVVQMEELRGQLGDALPGALPKVAKGLGITVAEMEKMSRNGELLASEVFPALQRVLEESSGQVDTISARWARFKNVMTETAQDLGEGGIGKALGDFGAGAIRIFEHLAFTATLASESFTTWGKRIGIAAADVAEQGLKFRGFSDDAKQAFKEADEESDKRLTNLAARIDGTTTAAGQSFGKMAQSTEHAGQAIQVVGDKIIYANEAIAGAAPGLAANAAAHTGAADAASKNAAAQTQAGAAATTGAQAAAAADVSWTRLAVSYGKVNDVINQQVTLAKANLDTKKAEGAAAQEVARLSGDEAAQRRAAADAAVNSATAQTQLTAALSVQLNVLRAQRDAEVALYNASTQKQEAQRLAIVELNKSIEVKDQELKKNQEVTQSLRTEAAERKVAIETLKDNSARVNELKAAYATAQIEVERLTRLQREGKASTDQVADAKRAAATAEHLYSDALADQIAKMQEAARAQQAQFSLQEQTVRLALEEARTAEEVAKAKGDYKAAAEASNRVKELEIELLRLQAQAQRAEAEAVLAALPAKRAQLELEGKLTEAMKKSLEAEELSAKAKLKQAEITDELANRTARVAAATREASEAAASSADGYEAMGGAMDRAATSADRLGRSLARTRGGTSIGPGEAPVIGAGGQPVEGFVQKTVMGMDQDAIAVLRQKRDLGLLSSSDRAAAEAAVMAETANAATLSGMNQAYVSGQAVQQAGARARDAKEILDKIRALEAQSQGGAGAAGPTTMAPEQQGAAAHAVVNITLNGATTSVKTASQADANALTGLLKQLGDASQRTSY